MEAEGLATSLDAQRGSRLAGGARIAGRENQDIERGPLVRGLLNLLPATFRWSGQPLRREGQKSGCLGIGLCPSTSPVSGHGRNDKLWTVAQAVSEVLPDGDKEKLRLQGVLNQRDKIDEAMAEERLF